MKNQNSLVRRLRILLLFFGLFLLTAVVTLSDAQIVHGSENRAKSISSNAQTETVEASRGIITDRNGKVLVGNKLAYSLEFSSKDFTSDDELNTAILRLVNLMQSSAVSWNDTLPVQMAAPFDLTGYDNVTGLESLLKKHKIAYTKGDSLTIGVTGAQLLSVLRNDYGVDSSLSDSDARLIVGVRYGLDLRKRRLRRADQSGGRRGVQGRDGRNLVRPRIQHDPRRAHPRLHRLDLVRGVEQQRGDGLRRL